VTSGWIALLDDLASLTKVAASSLDDAAGQAAKAGSKAAGIVIDDAAVTPRYVVGLAAERELPIIAKIAVGSLKNKLLVLLPGALLLSFIAPWTITPLLMAGGAFLCLEGYHKVVDLIRPGHSDGKQAATSAQTVEELEKERVSSAIRTDFILSAEIMAITLATVTSSPVWMQTLVLGVVGVGMSLLVYGAVAVIVKAWPWHAPDMGRCARSGAASSWACRCF
jgi:predicted DNA repair protein MutK